MDVCEGWDGLWRLEMSIEADQAVFSPSRVFWPPWHSLIWSVLHPPTWTASSLQSIMKCTAKIRIKMRIQLKSLDPVFMIRSVESRWITLMGHVGLGAGMEQILMERAAKGENGCCWGRSTEKAVKKIREWRWEGRQGNRSTASKNCLNGSWASEQMFRRRWCSVQQRREHRSFLLKCLSKKA